MDAELRKQPAAKESPNHPDNDIADKAEAGASHDLASEPSGNEADDQNDHETFSRYVHLVILHLDQIASQANSIGNAAQLAVGKSATLRK
jgi:hypothetical protein